MRTINGYTREAFISFLQETLIPDLKVSGHDATAEDFETAVAFMQSTDEVTAEDLVEHGISVATASDCEARFAADYRAFAFDEVTNVPVEVSSREMLLCYTPDRLLFLPPGYQS